MQTKKLTLSLHSAFTTFWLQVASPYPPALPRAQILLFFPTFSPNYSAVSWWRSGGGEKAIKYLRRTVVALAELRLGSTLEHLSSSVKSSRLVPCMWKSETRLHRATVEKEKKEEKTAPPLLPASTSQQQQSQAMRACMTSVGMWESGAHSWLVATRARGVPREVRIVELTNDGRDDSFLGYKFCQPIHCTERDSTR